MATPKKKPTPKKAAPKIPVKLGRSLRPKPRPGMIPVRGHYRGAK